VYLLDGLLFNRPANMRLPALGLHPTPTAPDDNVSPSAILLGRSGLQDTISPTTVIFLDDVDHQLLSVGNVHINLHDIFNGDDIFSNIDSFRRATATTKQDRSTRKRCLAKGESDVMRLMEAPSPGAKAQPWPSKVRALGALKLALATTAAATRQFLALEGIKE
jgi:hypothetical protein